MTRSSHWDAVVVGTGFGGSTTALKLVRAGRRVLMLERGRWVDRDESAWDPIAIHAQQKYRGDIPYDADHRRGRKLFHPDDVVGGKSVFYGAASFRLRREDFRVADRFGNAAPGTSPAMDWPITYDDLAPFYDEAEHAIGVAGVAGSDPTEPPGRGAYPAAPPPYGSSARVIAEAGAALGLKPFPIPLAINFPEGNGRPPCILCMTCDLFPCKISAKNDLSVTLLPEAQEGGAEIRPRTVATRVVIERGAVRGVECLHLDTGERYRVTCDVCVVSGGAIASAALLQASELERATPSGRLVGRYLMRHCSGIVIGVFPFQTNPEQQFHKQVAFTDFYLGHPRRGPAGPWGMIQAVQTPPPEFIEAQAYPLMVRKVGVATLPYHAYLLVMAEDLPRWENHVALDRGTGDRNGLPRIRVHHRYLARDLRARRGLYREAARILRRAGAIARGRLPIHTYSHAIGTCRFGTDPTQSVLDPWCAVHGVSNLFVVDGSFFPSSGGVNPSLTIAANGLRVGTYLVDEWDRVAGGG